MPEIFFEMRYIGNVVRVTAIDPTTGIEVITVGDANRTTEALKRVAARKLQYVLDRQAEERARKARDGDKIA